MNIDHLINSFKHRFDANPDGIASAPGRVNLIGEHTDYNAGIVLPLAIDRHIHVAFRTRNDYRVRLHSVNFDQTTEFSLGNVQPDNETEWADYVKGAIFVLQKEGHSLRGFDAEIRGDIPLASGLSSSAALEVAALLACQSMFDLELAGELATAKLAQRAENEFVGVQCGLMDQLISVAGKRDHAVAIDFASDETTAVPIPSDLAIIVGDTKLSRKLAGSTYNERRGECELGVKLIGKRFPDWGICTMSDITTQQLPQIESFLPSPILQRVRHVVTENERVRLAQMALTNGELVELGRLVSESHRSLRDDYQVSSDGLNRLVNAMESHPACLGSRLTGAGFGGCTIGLVHRDDAERFIGDLSASCHSFSPSPELFEVRPSEGGKVISLN